MLETQKLAWSPSSGGQCGGNYLLMSGDRYVGHFYVDASDGIDADMILEGMVKAFNEKDLAKTERGAPAG